MRLEPLYRARFTTPERWSVEIRGPHGAEAQNLLFAKGRCEGRIVASMRPASWRLHCGLAGPRAELRMWFVGSRDGCPSALEPETAFPRLAVDVPFNRGLFAPIARKVTSQAHERALIRPEPAPGLVAPAARLVALPAER